MLRPKEMSRVLILGPRETLDEVVEVLYREGLLHILDFTEQDETFSIGRPLEKASSVSEDLVKLRSISSILEVEAKGDREALRVGEELSAKIRALEVNLSETDESRKRTEELLSTLNTRMEQMKPFASFPLILDMYRGYESVSVFVGRVTKDLSDIDSRFDEYELLEKDRFIALFVPAEKAEEATEYLGSKGFTQVEIPDAEGDPKELLAKMGMTRQKWEKRLTATKERLDKLRKRYSRFILSAEEALAVESEKAEAPLRFATTNHSFIIDGWVPAEDIKDMKRSLEGMEGIFVDSIEPEGEEPPVLLDNPKLHVRRFEFLIRIFSTPSYDEVDPTLVLSLVFPIFFGLMIGDLGYGLVMMLFAMALRRKLKTIPELYNLMWVLFVSGVFASIFGTFLYGDIFGIAFHAEPGAHVWEGFNLMGLEIPYHAPIHKVTEFGAMDLIALSILGAGIHLGIGFLFGIINERKHSKKHALAKFGWLLVLVGLLVILMRIAAEAQDLIVPRFVWFNELANLTYPVRDALFASFEFFGAIQISIGGIVLVLVGVPFLVVGEGVLGIIEIVGLVANMFSYTRIAGVAVAKGATALAFNEVCMPMIFESGGNVGMVIGGFVALFFSHATIFFLGAISAGIQAIRLHYVEWFMKFFKGNGIDFKPFGLRAIQEV
ncbi:MAG: V-type ATP synthase subunit I [Thermoplasmata archaeon]